MRFVEKLPRKRLSRKREDYMLKVFRLWFRKEPMRTDGEIHGERVEPEKTDIEELRLAINDLAYQQAVLRTLVGRPSTEPKWDEQRIVNLELAHDPLHETIWDAIKGLQLSAADAELVSRLVIDNQRNREWFETCRQEILRLWERIGRRNDPSGVNGGE